MHKACDDINSSLEPQAWNLGTGGRSTTKSYMNTLIRTALQQGKGSSKWFLPIDKLFEIVSPANVHRELSRFLKPDKVGSYTEKVCSHIAYNDENTNRNLKSSRRCIFAILSLMNKIEDAPAFLDSHLYDRHLPLERRDKQTCEFYSHGNSVGELPTAQNWDYTTIDTFEMYQPYMLSPFFELSSKNNVPFHHLANGVALPWIEDYSRERRKEGHHGTVYRVKIHPAHHNSSSVRLLCCGWPA